jgi:hydroxypyruvate reductase/glycerate 2-kinase
MVNKKNMKENLLEIINAGIEAVKPEVLIPGAVQSDGITLTIAGRHFSFAEIKELYIIGFGKASGAMAFEVEKILQDKINAGAVVTSKGNGRKCKKIKVYEGNHPVVDSVNLQASAEIVTICNKAEKDDLIICLISGGGSALFEMLPPGITLDDIQALNRLLLLSGAKIDEVNTVRKQVSLVKGGRLIDNVLPAKCVSLIISDVIGDDISNIASGPLFRGDKNSADAFEILEKYRLTDKIPPVIRDFILNNIASSEDETDISADDNISNVIIGSNKIALEAAANKAASLGLNALVVKKTVMGEASKAGKKFAEIIKDAADLKLAVKPPMCIIGGGETTVTVKGTGKGGRNQELALSAFINLQGSDNYAFASCGTDGVDSIEEAAGGIVTGKISEIIKKEELSPNDYLLNNDSYNFLLKTGGVIPGKPTGTNVMDIMAAIVL